MDNLQLALLIIPTLCYAGAGVIFLINGDGAGGLTWLAYSVANVGLIWKFLF